MKLFEDESTRKNKFESTFYFIDQLRTKDEFDFSAPEHPLYHIMFSETFATH